jgi:hypothetical protein
MDAGDSTGDLRSTLYSANTIPSLAKERGIKYFFIMCDDYVVFDYSFKKDLEYWTARKPVKNLDLLFDRLLDFYKVANITSLAMAQGGDFIGGPNSAIWKKQLSRKAMNSFLCSTDRPFQFVGRMNEDVTTYVNLGGRGELFLTTALIRLEQLRTQEEEGGLTDLYMEYGTYIKSFFSVMYNPSCVRVSEIGIVTKRIHHKIQWEKAVPKIISDSHRKTA